MTIIEGKYAKILESEWVEPKKRGLGYKLKSGAPREIKEQFKEMTELLQAQVKKEGDESGNN